MLSTLRQRNDRKDEEGFTLIELMVVVLIIGILLAIAIPTFLGARNRASDRSAQSNLRNALTAEKTLYTDNQSYTDTASVANVSTLLSIEPSLTWAAGPASGFTSNRQVLAAVSGTGNSTVVLSDKSATGTCFYIGDVASTGSSGTYYMADTACGAPAAPGTGITNAHASSANATWSLAF